MQYPPGVLEQLNLKLVISHSNIMQYVAIWVYTVKHSLYHRYENAHTHSNNGITAGRTPYSPHRNKAEKTHKALIDNMTKYMQLSCKGAVHACSQSFPNGGIYL
jgi:hypothetical protein